MRKKARRTKKDAETVTSVVIAAGLVLSLPPELLCHTARFLSYPGLCAAVHVCRRWRATLLADKGLWTEISVMLAEKNSASWVYRLEILFKRAAGRPISLDLMCDQFLYEDHTQEYTSLEWVAYLVGKNMSKFEELNLSIPTCDTYGWARCLEQRAPILKVFRVHNTSYMEDIPRLPLGLFGGHAPLLEIVCLEQAYFPDEIFGEPEPMAALENVWALFFHMSGSLENIDLFDLLDHVLPSLTLLTCTVNERYEIERIPYEQDLDLRINVAPGVSDVIASFPNAESVIYSFAGRDKGQLDIVGSAIRSKEPATSVAIAWMPEAREHAWWHGAPSREPEYHTIDINGRPLIVDLHIDFLRTALTPEVVELLTTHVKTLAVVDALWPVFAPVDMPALEELTISLRARPDWGDDGSIFRQTPTASERPRRMLRVLRLARASGRQDVDDFAIPAALIATFVRKTVAPDCSPPLHLNGVRAIGEGSEDLAGAVARIVHEMYVPPDEPEPWSWDIKSEDALSC